jgi:RNA polymerase sigma-70 factor (ECF subfamily)
VQDLFVKYWLNRAKICISSSHRSYLFKSVRNSCLNFIKHRGIEENYRQYNNEEIEKGTFSLDEEFEGIELESKIRNAIDRLPPERKKVFIMCRFEGLKYMEIAEKSGISVKTVENQMGKAMKFLKEELAEYFPLITFLFLYTYFEQ